MQIASRMQTRTYGTVTHMPPELLQKGVFTKVRIDLNFCC